MPNGFNLGFGFGFEGVAQSATPVAPAPEVIGAATSVAYGARTNTTFDVPNGVEENDLLFVALFIGANDAVPAYSLLGFEAGGLQNSNDGSLFARTQTFVKVADADEPAQYTVTHLAANTELHCFLVRGVVTADVVDTQRGGPGGNSRNFGFVTSTPNQLAIGVGQCWGGSNQALPSGMALVVSGSVLDVWTQALAEANQQYLAKTWTNGNGGSDPWGALWRAVTANTVPPPFTNWPDATNTGPSGALTPSGPVTSSSNGQVIENLDITGTVDINHANVILRNCAVAGYVDSETSTDFLMEDCLIDGGGATSIGYFAGTNSIALRCNIFNCENGIAIAGNNVEIGYSFIHDLASSAPEPHFDGIQSGGGFTALNIHHNAVYSLDTSCILLQNDVAGFGGVIIDHNLLSMSSGAACLYLRGDKGPGPITTATVTYNQFAGAPADYYDLTDGPETLTWEFNTNQAGFLIQVPL